jgi:hypothetical protein
MRVIVILNLLFIAMVSFKIIDVKTLKKLLQVYSRTDKQTFSDIIITVTKSSSAQICTKFLKGGDPNIYFQKINFIQI